MLSTIQAKVGGQLTGTPVFLTGFASGLTGGPDIVASADQSAARRLGQTAREGLMAGAHRGLIALTQKSAGPVTRISAGIHDLSFKVKRAVSRQVDNHTLQLLQAALATNNYELIKGQPHNLAYLVLFQTEAVVALVGENQSAYQAIINCLIGDLYADLVSVVGEKESKFRLTNTTTHRVEAALALMAALEPAIAKTAARRVMLLLLDAERGLNPSGSSRLRRQIVNVLKN